MHIAEGKIYSGKIKLLKVDSCLITPYGHMSDQMHLSVLSTEKQSSLHILIMVRNYIIKEFRFIGGGFGNKMHHHMENFNSNLHFNGNEASKASFSSVSLS